MINDKTLTSLLFKGKAVHGEKSYKTIVRPQQTVSHSCAGHIIQCCIFS